MNTCAISWCIALATNPSKMFCPLHCKKPDLRPLEYKRPRVKKHWPPTPWDDEGDSHDRRTREAQR